jgi:hypothetical protein
MSTDLTLVLTNKYCHDPDCGYMYETEPEIDVYAHFHTNCPSCGSQTSVSSKIPDFHFQQAMTNWWSNHHTKKRDKDVN